MNTTNLFPTLYLIFFAVILPGQSFAQPQELPNILWIVSEDNSPLAGAYDDDFATTPNMDRLASEGFLYTHAYANAPVCAPARNTIITGVYANSGGNQHMRSNYEVSDVIKFFPRLLREAGYYTTNNAKEDYNIASEQTRDIWDESNGEAHYKNREDGQPFFAVFNSGLSHESSIHTRKPFDELRHDPEEVTLPPYHPDTPDIRRDWAHYYDNIEDMDSWIGEKLQELEESGEADNTIVFYYGDHGGVLPRSKRFVYDTGTHAPFIVRIPEKFKHLWPAEEPGNEVDRLISLVDLAPTLLSLTEIPIPEFMQGDAFLGEQKTAGPDYVFMFRGRMDERYDMSRAVRDQRYRYIRNFMPYRIYGQRLDYLWRAASTRSWEQACQSGECNETQNIFWNSKPVEELYDTQSDPWEVNNLADDPAYKEVLERMRKANQQWMVDIRDSGFIPEAELSDRSGDRAIYDYMRSNNVPLEDIIDAAENATLATVNDIPELISFLKSDDSAIRYWGATGLLILGEQAAPAIEELKVALKDPSPNVVVVASETLHLLGETSDARTGFENALKASNSFARTHVLNAIDSVDEDSREIKDAVINMAQNAGVLTR
ncbi:MAG: sulfatase, partial [Balneolales bacterium]